MPAVIKNKTDVIMIAKYQGGIQSSHFVSFAKMCNLAAFTIKYKWTQAQD
jgi:hypothetical protein